MEKSDTTNPSPVENDTSSVQVTSYDQEEEKKSTSALKDPTPNREDMRNSLLYLTQQMEGKLTSAKDR